jgi:gamma-glutamylcyclotransferase (GGCT)/AIG2-like uncharacterized protein YtfP
MTNNNVMIFVYGTLRSDANPSNSHLLGGTLLATQCTVRGTLYDFGQYPGIELDSAGGAVAGELWSVPKQQLKRLDSYEGSQYVRVPVEVRLPGRGRATAMIYEALDVEGLDRIPCDDWLMRKVTIV